MPDITNLIGTIWQDDDGFEYEIIEVYMNNAGSGYTTESIKKSD